MHAFLYFVLIVCFAACIEAPPAENNANNINNVNNVNNSNNSNNVLVCETNGDCTANGPNGEAACVDGVCQFVCADGFQDLNESVEDGCECTVTTETCDGQDNDCDGEVDNVDVCPTEGVCSRAISVCDDGTPTCLFPDSYVESDDEGWVCDGLDNDCDGVVDEGCCMTAPPIVVSGDVQSVSRPIILPSLEQDGVFTTLFVEGDQGSVVLSELSDDQPMRLASLATDVESLGLYVVAANVGGQQNFVMKQGLDLYFGSFAPVAGFTFNPTPIYTSDEDIIARVSLSVADDQLELAWMQQTVGDPMLYSLMRSPDPALNFSPMVIDQIGTSWLDHAVGSSGTVLGYHTTFQVNAVAVPSLAAVGNTTASTGSTSQFSLIELGGVWYAVYRDSTAGDLYVENFDNSVETFSTPPGPGGAFALGVDRNLDGTDDAIMMFHFDHNTQTVMLSFFDPIQGIRPASEPFSSTPELGYGLAGIRVGSRIGILFRTGSELHYYPMSQSGSAICPP